MGVSSLQIRKLLRRASTGLTVDRQVKLEHTISAPRLCDEVTFDAICREAWYGCYVFYCPTWAARVNLGASRIVYLGKGKIGERGLNHLGEKIGLRRLTSAIPLKMVAISWADLSRKDSVGAWLCEQILLFEHYKRFGDLPKFNKQRWTSEIEGWRRVIRWSPGPRKILNRYGGY